MKKIYSPNRFQEKNVFKALFLKINLVLMLLIFLTPSMTVAQEVYTIREGNVQVDVVGVSPLAIDYRNQRSQYIYTGDLLQNQEAPVGYITSVALKITQVIAANLQPENLQIKMGLTSALLLPDDLIPNLPVVYSSSDENILGTGWYTFVLDTPVYWDGYSNIVIEFCRTNVNVGDSYEIEAYLGLIGEYRTAGLASNLETANGCTLTGNNIVTLPNQRLLPSMQITMATPCTASPFPGSVAVSAGNNYCGEPFTLSTNNSTIASGLSYQWQYSFVDGPDYIDIPGATSPTLTTTQEFATYYRIGITCDALSNGMVFSPGLLVAGPGCLCNPTVTTMDAAGITNVTFGAIDNPSTSTSSYTDFRNITTNVQRLGVFPLSAKVTATTAPMFTKAWIDWNQDGIFSASESYSLGMVDSGADVSSGIEASVIVPTDAVLGSTIMRVRTASVVDMATLEPCGNTSNGETEDYSIIVQVADPLSVENSEIIKNSIVVYGYNQSVNIRSTFEDVKSVKIYDISGRLLFTKNDLNEKQTSIALPAISTQILIVEVRTVSGFFLNKKVNIK